MPIVTLSLLLILLILIILGVFESRMHQIALSKIPIRIHVNGTRGKSSVTRLIAAGLRSHGIKTFAKTTGSSPRFIDDKGDDHVIQRFRPASIGEQIRMLTRFSKESPKAVVMECMAVQPDYQWISEHKIVKSNYSVITNVRADHLEEMGYSLGHISNSLSNTIPLGKKVFTSEVENLKPIRDRAKLNNSHLTVSTGNDINKDYLNDFSFIEHPDNVALALSVCEEVGVKRDIAIKGMRNMIPDPGALTVTELKIKNSKITFVNAFAANDPQSTLKTWNIICDYYSSNNPDIAIFLNTRTDRQVRTQQLLDMIFSKMNPNHLIVRGDNLERDILSRCETMGKIDFSLFSNEEPKQKIIDKFSDLDNHLVVGIGNIVGWGEDFIRKLKGFKSA